ncbi:MAG TPA: acetyl-CoA carboxylase carboxyl transferase subunit alpha, partial [Coriobacteriia bacterium]|nr:acetyl-CoA carboxylase carboxyl transferase subunit alpha [Coriobacteriia bacterium]
LIMLEHAYYSVISPEMCAVILHKDAGKAPETASCLQMTADDLVRMGIADEIVPEPLGGAHRDPAPVFAGVELALTRALDELCAIDTDALVAGRQARLATFGAYRDDAAGPVT